MGQKKRNKNIRRDRERLEAFLQTKCFICLTPGQIPSRKLPCCGKQIHEVCLLKCFHHDSRVQSRCPHRRRDIVPLNQREATPLKIPKGGVLFWLEHEIFAPRFPEELAEERWNYMLFLVPLPGWAEDRMRWRS